MVEEKGGCLLLGGDEHCVNGLRLNPRSGRILEGAIRSQGVYGKKLMKKENCSLKTTERGSSNFKV